MEILNALPDDVTVNNSVILAIDFQKLFCTGKNGNVYTENAVQKMEKTRLEFNEKSVPIVWLHGVEDWSTEEWSKDPFDQRSRMRFYHVNPDKNRDYIVAKENQSGFKNTKLAKLLHKLKIKNVFGCGVSLPHCVKDTLIDAMLEDFTAYFIDDLSAECSFFGETIHPIISLSMMALDSSCTLINDASIVSSQVVLRHFKI